VLTKSRGLQLLGIGIGLALIGLTRSTPWTQLVAVWGICAVFFFLVSPRFYEKNARITSVGIWIAAGMTIIPAIAWSLGALQSDIFAWIITAWLLMSILFGAIWPLPVAKRLANEN